MSWSSGKNRMTGLFRWQGNSSTGFPRNSVRWSIAISRFSGNQSKKKNPDAIRWFYRKALFSPGHERFIRFTHICTTDFFTTSGTSVRFFLFLIMMIRHVLQGTEEDHRFFKTSCWFLAILRKSIFIYSISVFLNVPAQKDYIFIYPKIVKSLPDSWPGGKPPAIRFFTNSVHLLPGDPALSMQLKSNNGLGKQFIRFSFYCNLEL